MTIVVNQFGFTPASGSLANIVDGDVGTGWAPYATDLSPYTASFLHANGTPISLPFAALEFDYGEQVRLPMFLLQVEGPATLGDGMLIGSDLAATSTADVVHESDVLMGIYTKEELNAGQVLKTAAFATDIRKRYYRLCQHGLGVPITADDAPPVVPGGGGVSHFQVYDTGSGSFPCPDYTTTFIIELWGAGACGGKSADASDGADTTVSTWTLVAGGGNKASATTPNSGTGFGTGGTATGGNTTNTPGGDGGVPSPASTGEGYTGKGGDAPLGGTGGDAIFNNYSALVIGSNGRAPGGGGSGRNAGVIAGGTYSKYPGGGSGAYLKHVFIKGVGSPPAALDPIAWAVGAGALSPIGDGHGADGRVKFSWD